MPVAIFPMTELANPPPLEPLALLMALFVTLRLTTPERPPFKNVFPPLLLPEDPPPPPPLPPEKDFAAPTPRIAIIASASIEPPVCPTLIPKLLIKLSIFCDTFKKAMAHKNHTNMLPVTASLPMAST